jgi:hypothetical protein
MGKVTAYKNNDRLCFCHIQFDNRERVLVSIASKPEHSIKVIKLLAGIIPYKTIWEFRAESAEATDAYKKMVSMFKDKTAKPVGHPLDAIILKLLHCRSCNEAAGVLQRAEGRGQREKGSCKT